VDHLHVVTGTSLTHPVATRLAVDLSSGSLEDLLDCGPGGRRTTRHERGTVTGTLLTTRDTRTDEEEALGLELLGAADRIGVMRVTTIDDNVALLKVGLELADEAVNGRTSLDKEDNLARALELRDELLNRVGALDLGTWGDISRSEA
jgi:hypothetical protein